MANKDISMINDEMSDMIIAAATKIATSEGAHTLTVRKILRELEITNRVFYNRFHNIGEVLEIVYKNTVMQMRECLSQKYDEKTDFLEYVLDVLTQVLVATYDIREQFSQYAFEYDSINDSNYIWWREEIKKLVEYAKSKDIIKSDVDTDALSYSVWCFSRGFNADAICRRFTKDEAVEYFRYGMSFFLEGLKK